MKNILIIIGITLFASMNIGWSCSSGDNPFPEPAEWHKKYNNNDDSEDSECAGYLCQGEPTTLEEALQFTGPPLCTAGDCFVLSERWQLDYSTDYRAFTLYEVVFIGIRADSLDVGYIVDMVAGFVDPDGIEVEILLTNNGDGMFWGMVHMDMMPSNSDRWVFFCAIEDGNQEVFTATATIFEFTQ